MSVLATAFPKYITISNPAGSAYTSYRRACDLVARGHAQWSRDGCSVTLTERGVGVRPAPEDPVKGSFAWYVGWSGLARVMKAQHT